MHGEEKRILGIHTKDDNLFLHQDVIVMLLCQDTQKYTAVVCLAERLVIAFR